MRKIEAATAKLKLARLQAEKGSESSPHHKEALVDVARWELRVKLLEEEVGRGARRQASRRTDARTRAADTLFFARAPTRKDLD